LVASFEVVADRLEGLDENGGILGSEGGEGVRRRDMREKDPERRKEREKDEWKRDQGSGWRDKEACKE
jgi:hypothetical protein